MESNTQRVAFTVFIDTFYHLRKHAIDFQIIKITILFAMYTNGFANHIAMSLGYDFCIECE
ncbi:MAG: hypothetical protein EB121_00250 [Alphaproteobacteria bacterium]|nr:hypothetical protein [Alphaproteobacteria bacterium]